MAEPKEIAAILDLGETAWAAFKEIHTIENRSLKEMFLFGYAAGYATSAVIDKVKKEGKGPK